MPSPTEPCSNWRQIEVEMVCTPTGATMIEATSSRVATEPCHASVTRPG